MEREEEWREDAGGKYRAEWDRKARDERAEWDRRARDEGEGEGVLTRTLSAYIGPGASKRFPGAELELSSVPKWQGFHTEDYDNIRKANRKAKAQRRWMRWGEREGWGELLIDKLPRKDMKWEDYIQLGVGEASRENEEKQIEKIMLDFKKGREEAADIWRALQDDWPRIYNFEQILDREDFEEQNILGDGNCLYTAIYEALQEDAQGGREGGENNMITRGLLPALPPGLPHLSQKEQGAALRDYLHSNFDRIVELCRNSGTHGLDLFAMED